MNYPFNPQRGLVVVQAELFGPSGSIVLRLALDTGATGTMINVAPLTTIGYDPSLAPNRVQVTTGSGVEYAPRIAVTRIKAMGQECSHFPVLAHTLPPSASVEKVKTLLGYRAKGRDIIEGTEGYRVWEGRAAYNAFFGAEKRDMGPQNAYFWDTNAE